MTENLVHQGDSSWGAPEPIGITGAIGEGGKVPEVNNPFVATVLVRCRTGSLGEAFDRIRSLPNLDAVNMVSGDYDAVVRISGKSTKELSSLAYQICAQGDLTVSVLVNMDTMLFKKSEEGQEA